MCIFITMQTSTEHLKLLQKVNIHEYIVFHHLYALETIKNACICYFGYHNKPTKSIQDLHVSYSFSALEPSAFGPGNIAMRGSQKFGYMGHEDAKFQSVYHESKYPDASVAGSTNSICITVKSVTVRYSRVNACSQ